MSAKKTGGGMDEPSAKPSAETKRAPGAVYSAREIAAASAAVFGRAVPPDCVCAAFRMAGVTTATKQAAREMVENLMKKEIG